MRVIKVILFLAMMLPVSTGAFAQEQQAAAPSADEAALQRRLELATEIQELRPAKERIESAIERYTARIEPAKREVYRSALRNVFNYKALEKISIDAYADIYTEDELKAMLEYYRKPESKTAAEKTGQYADRVYPEIIRMLDRAMMRVKTGGAGDP